MGGGGYCHAIKRELFQGSTAEFRLNDFGIKIYAKNEEINPEIGMALKSATSKSGGKGGNLPDIQVFIETRLGRKIPVFIEAKGKQSDLGRYDENGNLIVSNRSEKGDVDYKLINRYAINGAVHYAEAVVRGSRSYKEAVAIGVNGWLAADDLLQTELAVYYISQGNLCVPKKIDDYVDFSFLKKSNLDEFTEKIDELELTEVEKEQKTREIENVIEVKLKTLNQMMQDKLAISVDMRVALVSTIKARQLWQKKRQKYERQLHKNYRLSSLPHLKQVRTRRFSAHRAERNCGLA